MITFFTIPKQFTPSFAAIQYNAIRSWIAQVPKPEIVLFGNEHDIGGQINFFRRNNEVDMIGIPCAKMSANNAPLVSSIFSTIRGVASNSILVYANADIIFMNNLAEIVTKVQNKFGNEFLIVGRRIDIEVKKSIYFTENVDFQFCSELAKSGTLHGISGIDYFIFSKDVDLKMPPFVVGRPRWDNWVVGKCLSLGFAVIDATASIHALHQKHDFSHITGGYEASRNGKDALFNKRQDTQIPNATIRDCNWIFKDNKFEEKKCINQS